MKLRRVTRLAKKTLDVRGTDPMPASPGEAPEAFPDGRYVLNGDVRPPGSAGHPLHIVSPDGRILRSFGGHTAAAAVKANYQRNVGVSGDSGVWVNRSDGYRIERWDTAGKLLAVYERRVDWFPAPDSSAWNSGIYPENGEPRVGKIHEDEQGRLWVKVAIPRIPPGWVPGTPWDKSQSEIFIEVLDTRERRVLASLNVKGWFGIPTPGPFFDVDTDRVSDSG
jgi:hypothetical protein